MSAEPVGLDIHQQIEREIEEAVDEYRQRIRSGPKFADMGLGGTFAALYKEAPPDEKLREAPIEEIWWAAPNGQRIRIHAAEQWQRWTPGWLRDGIFGGLGPRSQDAHFEDTTLAFRAKEVVQKKYAWAIPTPRALDLIAALGPVVEIGAGGGYWASLLRQGGVDVVAYDAAPGDNHWVDALWTDVVVGGIEDAGRHPERTLLLCWPVYDDPMAADALAAHRKAGGRHVVHIGEGEGGCCGDDRYWQMLDRGYSEVDTCALPQWWGLHDYVAHYESNGKRLRLISFTCPECGYVTYDPYYVKKKECRREMYHGPDEPNVNFHRNMNKSLQILREETEKVAKQKELPSGE